MTRIIILGASLAALSAAHKILDKTPEADIQIITERAEIGLMGEVPGLITTWPPCPSHWISEMASQTPNEASTAVRGSWFLKALGIQLSKRGCDFHLRTRVTRTTETQVHFDGAGPLGRSNIPYDYLLNLRPSVQESKQWYGLVCRTENAPEIQKSGNRTDGTTEVWYRSLPGLNKTTLQEMRWTGSDPATFISGEIESGMQLAQTIVDKIIHPVEQ
jgi:hypothetical protein